MVEGIESAGCLFNTAKETINAATQVKSSQRIIAWESLTGATGLKTRAIATNPTAHRGLPARILPRTTGITPAQRTISKTRSEFAEERHNAARSTAVMEVHFMIVVSIGKLVSPLSNDSSLMVTYYVEVIRASVQ